MKLSILALQLIIWSTSFAQSNNYQGLLDTAFSRRECLFVMSKPLQIARLDPKEIRYYAVDLEAYSHQKLDTTMFLQIIQNAKYGDTTFWSENELPNLLLVNTRSATVSKKYVLKKLAFTGDDQKKFYKKQVNKFNATEAVDRVICYFSRPVFDNSKAFAIIQWDNGHSYLGGGGEIVLYHFQDGTWRKVGIITSWKY